MGEQKTTAQLEEENNRLAAKVKKLEQCSLKQADDFEKTRSLLEQQLTETTLQFWKQVEQMLATTENIPGVIYQFYVTNKGEAGVRYVSPKLTEIFGIEFKEGGALFFQQFCENIHEEDKRGWFESIEHVVEKQIPWNWKGRYVKPTGDIVWFAGHSLPTVHEDEIVFDGLFIDITDKVEQERELRQAKEAAETARNELEQQSLHFRKQKEQMQAIAENVPGVIFQFYANNKGEAGVHYVSPKLTEIFGIEFIEDGALYFEKFSENIHEEDKQVWLESIGHVIEKKIPWKWKGRYVKTTGDIIWFEGHSLPTVREDETIFDGFFIDITDKIEQERELKQAKEAAETARNELEQRVAERTAQLDQKTERLTETNVALKILLEKREEDKKEFEEKIVFNVEKLVSPYLEKLKMICIDDSQKAFLEIIQSNLDEITSSFAQKQKSYLSILTPSQIQVADLIKQGKTTKEIASLLHLSPATIACHRQEIRKKLSLTGKKVNLQTSLATTR